MEFELFCEFEYVIQDYDGTKIYNDAKRLPTNIIINCKHKKNIIFRYDILVNVDYKFGHSEKIIKELIEKINDFIYTIQNKPDNTYLKTINRYLNYVELNLIYDIEKINIVINRPREIEYPYSNIPFEKDILINFLNDIVYHLENPEICFPKYIHTYNETVNYYNYKF